MPTIYPQLSNKKNTIYPQVKTQHDAAQGRYQQNKPLYYYDCYT